MAGAKKQDAESSDNSAQLEALLDKLVALQIDLKALCGTPADRAQAAATPKAIAEACDILQSAVADLRNIIHQVDGALRD
jgi:C4-dicarboxylate-specific signal transduction histidine kinase